VFVGTVLVASYATGLPELPTSRLSAGLSAVMSVGWGLIVVSLAQLALGSPLLPRAVVMGIGFTFVPFALVCWNAEHDRARRATTRALFIGSNQEYAELQADLAGEMVGVELIGRLDPAETDSIADRVTSGNVGLVILDMVSLGTPAIVHAVAAVHRTGVRIRTVSLFVEEFLGKVPVADLERMSLLFDIGELHRATYVRWKRVIDVVFGLGGLALLVPVAGAVWIGNIWGNPGSLLYRQPRVGKDGDEFEILKFRSMAESGATSPEWTKADDPRITPFGNILRKTHVDELPQAWNVLRGDLSIVGPRPEQPHYVEQLSEKIPFFDVRHLVRPGLTGWAQVNYPYGADEIDAREKLQFDIYYLRRQTPRLDIQILVRTIRAVIGRTGR
jgi:lipopolysaccharide/colanic/teichoic acid biosynthesis glycosyltransferase